MDCHRARGVDLGARCQRPAVGWFYFRHNEETARQAKVLTRDAARRMAVNFARLPKLLGKRDGDG
jgi:hypothetical protein